MNALTRWNQLRLNQLNEVETMQHSLRGLFNRSVVGWPGPHLRPPQWIPLVAVSENARGYVLKAQLPQVKAEDVQIVITEGMLTISGDRKFEQNRKKDYLVQHAYGRFAHSFALPPDARPAKGSAVFREGVLIVLLAKNNAGHDREQRCADSSRHG
ncbi:putative Heat shock protein, Hsp20 family [Verrucomicrobia bacterium]|nr:putative Heat shock protein, Hsp20 family [Verrucomicrobiota bacterium]